LAVEAGSGSDERKMISLDDEEMSALLALAAPLPPDRRSAFLESVAAELSKHPVVGAGLVSRIARERQRAFLSSNPMPTLHEPVGATRQQARRR
jgi:hypothetical protein